MAQPKNTQFFRGPSFEEALEQAIAERADEIQGNGGRTYFTEPSAHDALYHIDPVDGKRRCFPSGVPVDIGLGQPEPESISDRIRRQSISRAEAHARLLAMGEEDELEANDFQVDEHQNLDPFTGYEYSEEREEDEKLVLEHNLRHQKEQERLQALARRKAEYDEMKQHFEPAPTATSPAGTKAGPTPTALPPLPESKAGNS